MASGRNLKSLLSRLTDAHARHRERHKPTGFNFALSDRIDYLEPGHWDAVTKDQSFFLQRPYLRLLEQHTPDNLQQRYAMVFDNHQPVAAVVAQILTLTAANVVNPNNTKSNGKKPADKSPKKPSRRLKLKLDALRRVKTKILSCGNCLSWGMHGVALARDRDPTPIWPGVAEALYRIRRSDSLSGQVAFIMVKDVPAIHADSASSLARISYRPVETEPDMVLDINPKWRSHNDYLTDMSSKYRKAAQKILKDVDQAGFRVEQMSNWKTHRDRIHKLYLNVFEQVDVKLACLHPNYLPALAESHPQAFRGTAVWHENDPVGFVTTLRDGDTAVGYYIGYDPAANEKAPIYLRLLHAVVADAIDLGCKRISFGRTALEAKARLGAKPQSMHVWIRHRQQALNVIARQFLKSITHAEAPDRNPFSAAAE